MLRSRSRWQRARGGSRCDFRCDACVDAFGSGVFAACGSRGQSYAAANPPAADLETPFRNFLWIMPAAAPADETLTDFQRRKSMKKLRAVLLLAVIALGFAGVVQAEDRACCDSPDCCAHCDGGC
jgi:hypothetical protein